MMNYFFPAIAILYWLATVFRLSVRWKSSHAWDQMRAGLDRVNFILFTSGIILYINQLHVSNGEIMMQNYARPVSWLLFTWCLNAANLLTELIYSNHFTAIFANAGTALALSILPRTKSAGFSSVFNNDVQWLSVHRLCFLLGYSFCLLCFPLAMQYFWKSMMVHKTDSASQAKERRLLWLIDRMSYRMILWALPLLTSGIIIESLILLEHDQFPNPAQIWSERKEAFLAITTWFICGVYLHSRIFFSWKNNKSALLYLGSFLLILAGHFSALFF